MSLRQTLPSGCESGEYVVRIVDDEKFTNALGRFYASFKYSQDLTTARDSMQSVPKLNGKSQNGIVLRKWFQPALIRIK